MTASRVPAPARLLPVLLLLAVGATAAAEYHVGPGQPLAAIGDVPWESLAAGDRVYIHWRAAPYREKWVLNAAGTAAQPILVSGVLGPGGERPVVSGENAVTRTALDYWNEVRGVIKVGGSNVPPDGLPSYITIENLEIRSGRPPFTFTDTDGNQQAYADNAAAIYVEKAAHLTVRNCELHDSGNGLFSGAFDGQTQDLLIEANFIHSNGNDASIFHHNTYTSAIGITYQYNRFGPLRPGAGGNNLKDRSAGLVVRYNWIESGNRQLDLVEADDTEVIDHPSYRATHVYGNVLIEPDAGNSQIAHYGGDGGDASTYRKGTLYFYNNTLVSTRTGNTTLLRLSTNDETADARNNILYVTAAGNRLAMLNEAGALTLRNNWTKPGWVATHGTLTGSIDDDGSGVEGASPGFVDEAGQDYHLVSDADGVDAGTLLHPDVLPGHPLLRQYVAHLGDEPRPVDALLDIGAFEFCATVCSTPIFSDGFESGDASAWSAVVP